MSKEWADVVIAESERRHATMGDNEARLRNAVETTAIWLARVERLCESSDDPEDTRLLDDAQEAYDNAVHALNNAGYNV